MILPATDAQRKMFFALCNELGLDADKAKERAKQKYNLVSFTEITRLQVSELIEVLQERIKEKNAKR